MALPTRQLHAGGLKNPNIQLNTMGQEVHMGVECDGCGVCPIVGQRFNSQVVMNYDLCDRCQALPGADSVAPFRLVENQSGMSSPSRVLHRLAWHDQDNLCKCVGQATWGNLLCSCLAHQDAQWCFGRIAVVSWHPRLRSCMLTGLQRLCRTSLQYLLLRPVALARLLTCTAVQWLLRPPHYLHCSCS